MNTVIETAHFWTPYLPAILALTALCLVVMIQAFLTAPLAFLNQQQTPGMPLTGNHQQLSFRVLRTHLNSVESLAPFGFTTVLAIMVNTPAHFVNWLAFAHVAFRLMFWAVYYSGIGKVAGGIRTLSFVGGLVANMVLVVVVVVTL